jgi:glycosyltransferase involved in cell wall biosynthesis
MTETSPLGTDRSHRELPSLTVIIATLGRTAQLATALSSIRGSTVAPVEVLVVDGSETGDAMQTVSQQDALAAYPVRHVPSPRGLTTQRNVGLAEATGEVVVFLDDDAQVPPHALHEVQLAYGDPGVVGVTARIVEPHGNRVGGKVATLRRLYNVGGAPGTFNGAGYPRRLQVESLRQDIQFMQGAFMSARLAQARQVMFDELLPGYGLAEDEDFSYRLSRLGRIRYLGDVEIQHDNAGFAGRDHVAFARDVVRHRRYLFHKNFEQTRRSRAQFGLLLGVLVAHRLSNRELRGAAALAASALRGDELGLGPRRR